MLVLSRRQDESIEIDLLDGTRVEIHVVMIRGDKVRLGIDADKKYPVHRNEVARRIEAKAAAQLATQEAL